MVQQAARDHLVVGQRIVLHVFEGTVLYNFIYLLWCQGLAQERTDPFNHWPQILQVDSEINSKPSFIEDKNKQINKSNLDHLLIRNIQKIHLVFVGVPRLDVLKPAIPINWNNYIC